MRSRALFFTSVVSAFAAVMGVCRSDEVTIISADAQAMIAYNNPVWSPDGRSLAYVSMPYQQAPNDSTGSDIGKSVYVATLAGGTCKKRLLMKDADWPVWSSDGAQIALNRGGLAIVNVSSGKSRTLLSDKRDPELGLVALRYPVSWSPGGRYLLYIDWQTGGCVTPTVIDNKTGKALSTQVGEDGFWMSGTKLLSARRSSPEASASSQLRITDFASGSSRTLVQGAYLMRKPFIPKGASYAWVWITGDAPKGEGIYRADLKTGKLTKMVAVRAKELYWSPDGKQFAFIADWSPRAGAEVLSCLYIGNTKTWAFKIASKSALKADDPWHAHASWSPNGKSIAYVTADGSVRLLKP